MSDSDDQDQTLTCSDCGMQFTFTERDQQYYKERGFVPPRRCRTCREKRKTSPHGVPKLGSSEGSDSEVSVAPGSADGRSYFKIVCAACGVETTVPFKPDPQRPAFCRKCYVGRRKIAGEPGRHAAGLES